MIGLAVLVGAFVLAVLVLGWIAANEAAPTGGHLDEKNETWAA